MNKATRPGPRAPQSLADTMAEWDARDAVELARLRAGQKARIPAEELRRLTALCCAAKAHADRTGTCLQRLFIRAARV